MAASFGSWSEAAAEIHRGHSGLGDEKFDFVLKERVGAAAAEPLGSIDDDDDDDDDDEDSDVTDDNDGDETDVKRERSGRNDGWRRCL